MTALEVAAPPATKRRVQVGDTVRLRMPWSEVCLHMNVADRPMLATVGERMVQLATLDGRPFSAPITHGEAGVHTGEAGFYVLPEDVCE